MIWLCTIFCLIWLNIIGEAYGAGKEADNGNGKEDDLLFGQMWRKAFAEANWHNGKEEEQMAKKEVKQKQKEEAKEEDEEEREKKPTGMNEQGQKEEEGNKLVWKKVKREPIDGDHLLKEEEENKLVLKKVKREPIDGDHLLKEENDGDGRKGRQNWQKTIKKESKIEENDWWENLVDKSAEADQSDQQQDDYYLASNDQNDSDQSATDDDQKTKRTKNESEMDNNEAQINLLKEFDRMREEYKIKKGYKWKDRAKIEREIARELGTYRGKIFKLKKELTQKRNPTEESEKEKKRIIEKFDKMRAEYKMNKEYKSKDRIKIEEKIAKELGTYRNKIYDLKNELTLIKKSESEAAAAESKRKRKRIQHQGGAIIEHFEQLTHEFSNKFNMKPNKQIEERIAQKFGICRKTI